MVRDLVWRVGPQRSPIGGAARSESYEPLSFHLATGHHGDVGPALELTGSGALGLAGYAIWGHVLAATLPTLAPWSIGLPAG